MGCQQARLALIGSHLNLATSGQRRESREKLSKTCHFEIGKIRTSSHTMTQCWQGKRRGPLHKQKGFVASSGIKPSHFLGCNRPVCLPIQQMCFPSCQICGTTFWKCSMTNKTTFELAHLWPECFQLIKATLNLLRLSRVDLCWGAIPPGICSLWRVNRRDINMTRQKYTKA